LPVGAASSKIIVGVEEVLEILERLEDLGRERVVADVDRWGHEGGVRCGSQGAGRCRIVK